MPARRLRAAVALAAVAIAALAGAAAAARTAPARAHDLRRAALQFRTDLSTVRIFAETEADDPLRRLGPLQGAAQLAILPGGATAAIWADQPAEAGLVRALSAAARAATPVVLLSPLGCGPLEQATVALVPRAGPPVDVTGVWLCSPSTPSPGGFAISGTLSPRLVDIAVGNRDLGTFRAPALAEALRARGWPSSPANPLSVSPAACPPGCTLRVAGSGVIAPSATLTLEDDAGNRRLATVQTHDGAFLWNGRLPPDVPPGNVWIADNAAQAPVAVLPPGMASASPPSPNPVSAAVRMLPDAALPYPPDAGVPQPATVASVPGGALWVGGDICSGRPATCAAAAWVSGDRGASWRQAFSDPGGAGLDGVFAMAAGPGGAALLADGRGLWRTANQGAPWTLVPFPGGTPAVLAVVADDASRAWAATTAGGLWRSTDGGALWSPAGRACPSSLEPVGLAFSSAAQGEVACANPADPASTPITVRATGDGGARWRAVGHGLLSGMASSPLAVAFAGRTLWAAGVQAGQPFPRLLRSTDGGRAWSAVLPPGVVSGGSVEGTPVAGVAAVGGTPFVLWPASAGIALYGTPGGAVFGLDTPQPGGPVSALTPSLAFAANAGVLLRSSDAGQVWLPVHRFAGADIRSVSFANPEDGWVVADPSPRPGATAHAGTCPPTPAGFRGNPLVGAPWQPCLLRTTDGGASWTVLRRAPPDPAWVGAFPGGAAVVVTGAGAVYRSAAGGGSGWVAQGLLPRNAGLVAFGSADFGAAVIQGMQPTLRLAVTGNGGRTWRTQRIPVGQSAVSLSAAGAGGLWLLARACAANGPCTALALRSANAGATWTATPLGQPLADDLPNRPFTLAGVTASAAWILVSGHEAYRTADGGLLWSVA